MTSHSRRRPGTGRERARGGAAPAGSRGRIPPGPVLAPALDRFDLYELCAQAPARDARVLQSIHGGTPPALVLGEDFAGAAAISRAWANLSRRHRAVAVDRDAVPLAKSRPHTRVGLIRADVLAVREPVDIIAALNFSVCELRDRPLLVAYLRNARARLAGGARGRRQRRGCFVCDIYGGSDAFITGTVRQRIRGPAGERIVYSWEQRTADPLNGRVCNAMHFRISPPAGSPGRARAIVHENAFVYDWRLWSVPELRDAMHEAGFAITQVFPRQPDAIDDAGALHFLPIEDAAELGDSFSVYVVARG